MKFVEYLKNVRLRVLNTNVFNVNETNTKRIQRILHLSTFTILGLRFFGVKNLVGFICSYFKIQILDMDPLIIKIMFSYLIKKRVLLLND